MLRLSRLVELGLGLFLILILACVSDAHSRTEIIQDEAVGDIRTESFSAGVANDTIIIRDIADTSELPEAFVVEADGAQIETFTDASSITELIINAAGGADSITFESIDPAFEGTIRIAGGGGDDTFVVATSGGGGDDTFVAAPSGIMGAAPIVPVPGVDATWRITGINAGTYEPAVGTTVTFSDVENITAADEDDEFYFDSGAGISGEIDDGLGNLTVGVAGFVQVSDADVAANYDFVRVTPLNVGHTTSASALTVGGTTGTGFFGVGTGDNRAGVEGDLGPFGLAIVTDLASTRAWHAFSGQIWEVVVGINDEADDGSWIDFDAHPLTVGPVTLDFATSPRSPPRPWSRWCCSSRTSCTCRARWRSRRA